MFDTICLRHKKWGTEVELFIGSHGKFKTRPSPLHQVTTVEVDGTWFEWVANYEEMDAPHIFDFLWERSGGPAPGEESRMPSWDKGQYCWEEAMGGADDYLYNGREPCVPSGARAVDVEALSSEAGWVPCQDRWADFDLFNTTYIRPAISENRAVVAGEDPKALVRHAIGVLEGAWCARLEGTRVVWTNKHSYAELHLTVEGFVFLSDWHRWRSERPQAVRVEYGMAGCVDGVNVLYTLNNSDARRFLGLASPSAEAKADLATAPPESLEGRLYEWTELNGWHNLQRRLLDRGRDAELVFEDMMGLSLIHI